VCGESIVLHELMRDLARKLWLETAIHIDIREFVFFEVIVLLEGPLFELEIRALRIRLRADRDIFARRHRHGASDEAGRAREQDIFLGRLCRCDADDETGRRNDAVICAKYGCTQPADPMHSVVFFLTHSSLAKFCAVENGWQLATHRLLL
jgi:hypothetical protein